MGCCFSRSAGPNSPYPGGVPDSSSRAINPPPLTLPESVHSGVQAAAGNRRRRDPGPLHQHINRPLRRHKWVATRRQWSKRELAKERTEFFDTRVAGRPEIWQTLHAALQAIWEQPPPTSTTVEDMALATAQIILDAAEISLPTGDLANGAYDPWGNLYSLPEWIASDPSNVADDEGGDIKGDLSTAGEETQGEDDDVDIDEAERRREEKGKAILDEREMTTLRARLSETGRDVEVSVGNTDSIRVVIRKISEAASIPSERKIRLAYMGKMLKEAGTLEAQGWHSGHIVNALVFER